jgi:predicted nucleic acid-binding protein
VKRLLMDTNALYALVSARDSNHNQAGRFFTRWVNDNGRAIILDTVFGETMTLIKTRLGAPMAVEVGRKLRQPALYEWLALSSEDETNTWETFQRYADKEWSYVDCGLFVTARRLGLPIFSFDHHFDQMPSIQRVP